MSATSPVGTDAFSACASSHSLRRATSDRRGARWRMVLGTTSGEVGHRLGLVVNDRHDLVDELWLKMGDGA